jgi:hypothetical protein
MSRNPEVDSIMGNPSTPRDECLWEKVRQARLMSFEEKFLAGPRLFDAECRKLTDAIRAFIPHADEATVEAILGEVIAWRERVENRPCPTFTT